jgi:hypothetical protein
MAGNAAEWVSDHPALYPDAEDYIPSGILHLFPGLGVDRVVRGIGSYIFYETRVPMRWSFYPEAADSLFGFRCVYSP